MSAAKRTKKSARKTSSLRRLIPVLVVALIVTALGFVGWQWMDGLAVEQVAVRGAAHAEPDSLVALSGVEPGVRLLDVDPVLVADRVVRHPWVESAAVRRLPTGTVEVAVRERRPVALALDRRGRPAVYLDASGFMMPPQPGAGYDVPLVRGLRLPYHPVTPVPDSLVLGLLAGLDAADARAVRLVAELELRDGDVWAWAAPAPQGAIPVRLGRADFAARLHRLQAFWQQAVLPRPEHRFDTIDLRFAHHVVTRETAPD